VFGKAESKNLLVAEHFYSPQRAIEEGFLLRVTDDWIDVSLDSKFKITEKERAAALASFVATELQTIIRTKWEPNNFPGKALLVLPGRESLSLVYEELLVSLPEHIRPSAVFSPFKKDGSLSQLTESGLDYARRNSEKIMEDFNNPEDRKHVLMVVTSKLLTGYDNAYLQAMFLDREIKSHVLAVPVPDRLCRKAGNKPPPSIRDFRQNFEIVSVSFLTFGSRSELIGERWRPICPERRRRTPISNWTMSSPKKTFEKRRSGSRSHHGSRSSSHGK
jgi:hypothetical protein